MNDYIRITPIVIDRNLSRVWRRIHWSDVPSFAIISAHSAVGDNERDHQQLKDDLFSETTKYVDHIELLTGFTYLDGPFEGETHEEKSYFITGVPCSYVIGLAQKYNQKAILWKDPESFDLLGIHDSSRETIQSFGSPDNQSTVLDDDMLKQAVTALIQISKRDPVKLDFLAEYRFLSFPDVYMYQKIDRKYGTATWMKILE